MVTQRSHGLLKETIVLSYSIEEAGHARLICSLLLTSVSHKGIQPFLTLLYLISLVTYWCLRFRIFHVSILLLSLELADTILMLCEPIRSRDNISLLLLELRQANCVASTVRFVESTILLLDLCFGLDNSSLCSLEGTLYLSLLGLSGRTRSAHRYTSLEEALLVSSSPPI